MQAVKEPVVKLILFCPCSGCALLVLLKRAWSQSVAGLLPDSASTCRLGRGTDLVTAQTEARRLISRTLSQFSSKEHKVMPCPTAAVSGVQMACNMLDSVGG